MPSTLSTKLSEEVGLSVSSDNGFLGNATEHDRYQLGRMSGQFLVDDPGGGNGSNLTNVSVASTTEAVPRDLFFNDDTMVSVIAYSVLFFVAALGNLTVFITLFRNRHRKSRVNLFIMHLSIADMIVTFLMMPMEIGWHVTVSWEAGDAACRILMFCRAFGFYLSSFILVAISLDRYFAITHPLSINDADRRGKLMLLLAWLFSIVASTPQSVIFHVEQHPRYPWFTQCVTFNFFPTTTHELAYNLFNMGALYGAPLIIITISYSMIMWEISKRFREGRAQTTASTAASDLNRRTTFRRSGIGRIEKARIRTLKMTLVIVIVFITCWTPYFVINAWFWIDKQSAARINWKVTRGLLIFAVSNSCVNPLVYGMFTHTCEREFRACCLASVKRTRRRSLGRSTSKNRLGKLKRLTNDHLNTQPHNATGKLSQQALDACAHTAGPEPMAESNYLSAGTTSSSGKLPLKRQLTPPHIAQGMGQKDSFDKFLLI